MIFYLIGVATDEHGQEIPNAPQSVYAVTAERSVAVRALDVFRQSQDDKRITYAPGTVCAVNDRAFQAECAHRNAQREAQQTAETEPGLGKLLEFVSSEKDPSK